MNTFRTVTIVGVGLIGGSIGLALRKRIPTLKVIGTGSRPATLEAARQRNAITEIASDAKQAVADSQLVVVCAPVDHIADEVRKLVPFCRPGTLITDAGSTKVTIVDAMAQAATEASWPAGVQFVGSHPLAGNEKKGPQHADADLFIGRSVVITPVATTRQEDLTRLRQFWTSLGARVIEMSAEEHDRALAITSHLPHLAAAAIAGETPDKFIALTSSGWRDTTRIAAGDPLLWRQIMLANRENLLAALSGLRNSLDVWHQALETRDGELLERLLQEAKAIRDLAVETTADENASNS